MNLKMTAVLISLSSNMFVGNVWAFDISQPAICTDLLKEKEPTAVIIAETTGELGWDERPDTVFLFAHRIGKSMDRSGAQYIVACPSSNPVKLSSSFRVGMTGQQTFGNLSIRERKIILDGKGWGINDPAAGPTVNVQMQFLYLSDIGFFPLAWPQPGAAPDANSGRR